MTRVAVVGGGIAGLAAALRVRELAPDAEVVVLEATDRVGGKLRQQEVAGLTIDVGAEAMLARRPEGVALAHAAGLGDELVHPAAGVGAGIWTRGAVRPLPPTVQGIPSDLEALAASGILAEAPVSHPAPAPADDVSVAEFVTERVGQDVLDRLVEPLLGGVYAGRPERLSLQAAAPQVAALAPDLLAGAAAARERTYQQPDAGPVFACVRGGMGRLPGAVAAASGAQVRTGAPVRDLVRHGDGWRLTIGPAHDLDELDADLVVVATPGAATSRLLAELAPEAAFALADVEYGSMAIASLVLDGEVEGVGTGFLVPAVEGTAIKASTFSSHKWPWVAEMAPGRTVLRTSMGRVGDSTLLGLTDGQVVERSLADLTAAVGPLPPLLDAHVQRWGSALPQYDVGHLARVDVVERSVAEVAGLEVCGAAYRGIGIPAVVANAHAAVDRLLATA
ncbi:protoporphyrinogen oxidase [Aeromicrobium massiliense]|uniref:protoporphyrinogen oxidase n=1 Tax=Aeromicrobium massiliense TaxID=1464554 RepID=UPI000578418D|nr:protoporphyrinogen oxidase [Aeromicrobium massiliense]